jgi:hypothetical protein
LLAFNLLRGRELGAAFATWLLVIVAVGDIAGIGRALEAKRDDRGQLLEQTVVTSDMRFIREMALKWYRASPGARYPSIRASGRWSAGRSATSRPCATTRRPGAWPGSGC